MVCTAIGAARADGMLPSANECSAGARLGVLPSCFVRRANACRCTAAAATRMPGRESIHAPALLGRPQALRVYGDEVLPQLLGALEALLPAAVQQHPESSKYSQLESVTRFGWRRVWRATTTRRYCLYCTAAGPRTSLRPGVGWVGGWVGAAGGSYLARRCAGWQAWLPRCRSVYATAWHRY